MLRDKLIQHKEPVDGFRWRSHEITRIEGFSDAVFGFAVTLLIVSLEVPRTSTELLETMRGFGAFVITFGILARLWYAQFTFFRRYGLEDKVTVTLNLVLLFTVLFFVYPLKFLFTNFLVHPMLKGTVHTAHGVEPVVLPQHRPYIYLVFGAGFAAVFGVFFFLYRHAYKRRAVLELNELETFETEHSIRRFGLAALVGLGYLPLAGMQMLEAMPSQTPTQKRLVIAGALSVFALFVVLFFIMVRMSRNRKRVHAEFKARQAPEPPRTDE